MLRGTWRSWHKYGHLEVHCWASNALMTCPPNRPVHGLRRPGDFPRSGAFGVAAMEEARWVTERDRLRRWGAELFSSFNAQRNRCDFLPDLLPAVISGFQRLVPRRWLSSRKIRWIELTIKPKKHTENAMKHFFWRRWIEPFWSLTKHVSDMTRYINWRTKIVFKSVFRNSASTSRQMISVCTAPSS